VKLPVTVDLTPLQENDSISSKHATAKALPPPSAGKRKALPSNIFITVDDFGNWVETNAS
jgi:hypothetical protein